MDSIWEWLLSVFSVKSIIKLLVFCTVDFAIPLWYLIAMAETYVFWLIIVKHKKEAETLRLILLKSGKNFSIGNIVTIEMQLRCCLLQYSRKVPSTTQSLPNHMYRTCQ